jgi:release factor glutamine methyltransferase
MGQLLSEGAQRLEGITETPRLEAELLLAHALRCTRSQLLARLKEEVDTAIFQALVDRRLAHEPVAYILGTWEFFSLEFRTRPPMLIPRPETEHLVEAALDYVKNCPVALEAPSILDLCTGSGCVAITLARNVGNSQVTATDLNPDAIALTLENAALHGVDLRCLEGDLFEALPPDAKLFDIIVSNPPYVEEGEWPTLSADIRDYEDPRALLSGADGLDLIRRLINEAGAFLKPGGLLAFEMGERHVATVETMLHAAGFVHVSCRADLAGIPRIAVAQIKYP